VTGGSQCCTSRHPNRPHSYSSSSLTRTLRTAVLSLPTENTIIRFKNVRTRRQFSASDTTTQPYCRRTLSPTTESGKHSKAKQWQYESVLQQPRWSRDCIHHYCVTWLQINCWRSQNDRLLNISYRQINCHNTTVNKYGAMALSSVRVPVIYWQRGINGLITTVTNITLTKRIAVLLNWQPLR